MVNLYGIFQVLAGTSTAIIILLFNTIWIQENITTWSALQAWKFAQR